MTNSITVLKPKLMNKNAETESNALDVFPRLQLSPSDVASFAHHLDLDENPGLEVKADVVDQLLASPRKKRAEVQYGKKTKLRARISSIGRSPTKLHNRSPSSDIVSSTSMVASTSSHQPDPHPKDQEGSALYVASVPSFVAGSDESDLTSLSSPMRSSSPGVTGPFDNDVSKLPIRTPPNVVPLTACLGLKYGQLAEPAWSTNDLDSYVWVLLEPKSSRVYDPDRDKNDCKERLWWPAKVCATYFEYKKGPCLPQIP